MYKKTIEYEDLEGEMTQETLYFNLNKVEVAEIEAKTPGGIEAFLNKCVKENNTADMFDFIKMLMLKAYGVKSADGKKLLKSAEIRYDFEMSNAFSEIFMSLMENEENAAAFLNSIIPKNKSDNKVSAIPPQTDAGNNN